MQNFVVEYVLHVKWVDKKKNVKTFKCKTVVVEYVLHVKWVDKKKM